MTNQNEFLQYSRWENMEGKEVRIKTMGTGIFLDYEKGILLVNGEKTNCPVRVVLKTGDGRDMAKLMNYENLTPESADSVTEVTVDVRGLQDVSK